MICEKCAVEMATVICSHCGGNVTRLGPYCYICGGALDAAPAETESGGDLDLSKRILCSDEACIGVVNEEGFCKVCGKPYTPDPQG